MAESFVVPYEAAGNHVDDHWSDSCNAHLLARRTGLVVIPYGCLMFFPGSRDEPWFGRLSGQYASRNRDILQVTMVAVSIRLEESRDVAEIRETNEQAFGTPVEARLVDALRGSRDSISLVATMAGHVIGHILFTPVTIDPPVAFRVAGLAPMSVRPRYQRQGVGGQLVQAGLDECHRLGHAAVVLVGHPEYYPRFGFVPAQTKGLKCEFPVPQEAFMVLELDEGALAGLTGVVRYRPEFAAE